MVFRIFAFGFVTVVQEGKFNLTHEIYLDWTKIFEEKQMISKSYVVAFAL